MKRLIVIYLLLVVGIAGAITGGPWVAGQLLALRVTDRPAGPAPVEEIPAIVVADVEVEPAAPAPEPVVVAVADATSAAFSPDAVGSVAQDGASAAAALAAVVAPPAADDAAAEDPSRGFPVVRGGTASLEQTTSAILADLAIVKDAPDAGTAALEEMSSAAVAGLKGARGKDVAGPATLEDLVSLALREGKPDAEIDAIVNAAASSGDLSVPGELVTPEGRVDTAVLLASLVTQAQIAAGVAEPVNPDDIIFGGAGVESYLVTKAVGEAEQVQFYTVAKGDSLGAIANRFYGDAVRYTAIFEANRAILSSPDRLNVGQRLVIPKI